MLLDFATVDHLSSAALGMLINANNKIKLKNGQLRLANIKPQIMEVFVITKLEQAVPYPAEPRGSDRKLQLGNLLWESPMAAGGSHRDRKWSPGQPAGAQLRFHQRKRRRRARSWRSRFPPEFDAGHEVQRQILADVEKAGFSQHSFFAIKLALEEALVNAIKHGNRLDPHKTVSITANVSPQRAEISIEDEGAGFERCNVPDPTCDENLEKCSGRGILLIESYMSSVRWDRGGRRLKMVKENVEDRAWPKSHSC